MAYVHVQPTITNKGPISRTSILRKILTAVNNLYGMKELSLDLPFLQLWIFLEWLSRCHRDVLEINLICFVHVVD